MGSGSGSCIGCMYVWQGSAMEFDSSTGRLGGEGPNKRLEVDSVHGYVDQRLLVRPLISTHAKCPNVPVARVIYLSLCMAPKTSSWSNG